MNDNGLSAADIAAVTDKNNGYAYPYPVYPYGGAFGGNSFGGDGSWIWFLLILALFRLGQQWQRWSFWRWFQQ